MKQIILYTFIGFFLAACSEKAAPEQSNTPEKAVLNEQIVHLTDEQLNHLDIQTAELQLHPLATTLQLNGKTTILPENESVVSSLIDGQLTGNKAIEGMYVRKGQVLAWLENTQFIDWQEQLLIARAKYTMAKAEWERQTELNQTKSASDKVVQQAKYAMQEQAIMIQTLSNKLQMIGIRPSSVTANKLTKRIAVTAPISGYVRQISTVNGTYVSPSDVLMTISDASSLLLKLKVYQDDMPYLSVGQSVKAKANTGNQEIKGSIKYINTALNEEGFGEIICSIHDKSTIPGMYLTALIELNGKEVYAIPSAAIVDFEGKRFVYVKKSKNEFKAVEITSSVEENKMTEITNFKDLLNKPIVIQDSYALLMKEKNLEEE